MRRYSGTRRYIILIIGLTFIAMIMIAVASLIFPQSVAAYDRYHAIVILSALPTLSVTPSPTVITQIQASSWIDSNFISAIIGALGVTIAAVVGVFVDHFIRHIKEQKAEKPVIGSSLQKSKTIEEHFQTYLDGLRNESSIIGLRILGKNEALDVINIYVRLRLLKDIRSKKLDQNLLVVQGRYYSDDLARVIEQQHEKIVENVLDPIEAIKKYKHCIIVGDPGSGKTTILKYLTIKSVEKSFADLPEFPIYIELKAFAGSPFNDLLEFISVTLGKQFDMPQSDVQHYLSNLLHKGRILMLLDGLDETFIGEGIEKREENYRRISNTIKHFKKHYKESSIVVTVRKAVYQQGTPLDPFAEPDPYPFAELEILGFRLEDIQEFVTKWFAHHTDGQADDLNRKLENNSHVRLLATNPLLLSLIAILYEAKLDLDLPDRRAKLYKSCINLLIDEWDAKRNTRQKKRFEQENLEVLLENIAYYFHKQRKIYFKKDELLREISQILPAMRGISTGKAEEALQEITGTNGLLKEQAEEWYSFLHLTFQEYFVAQHIAQVANEDILLDIILHSSDEPWWEEVVLLSAWYIRDSSPVLKKLLQQSNRISLEENTFQTNLIMAGRYMAASKMVRQTFLEKEITDRLFEVLTNTPYSLIRQLIIDTLIDITRSEVNMRLMRLLEDPLVSQDIHELIVDKLAIQDNQFVELHPEEILCNPHISIAIRKRVAIKLTKPHDDAQIGKLLRILNDVTLDADIRAGLADGLAATGAKHIIIRLYEILEKHILTQKSQEVEVNIHVIDAISDLGGNKQAHQLRSLLSKGALTQSTRMHIINTLGHLSDKPGVEELLQRLLDPNIDEMERVCIADIIGKLADSNIISSKIQVIYANKQNTAEICQCAALILLKLGDKSPANQLLQLLSDTSVHISIRQSAATGLVCLNDEVITDKLLKCISDNSIDTLLQKCIVDALETLAYNSFMSKLTPLVSNPKIDPDIQGRVAHLLEIFGDYSIISELFILLRNNQIDIQIRQILAKDLISISEYLNIPELLEFISDEQIDADVRKQVANVVALVARDAETVRFLADLLPTSDIKDAIHQALWKVSRQARVKVYRTAQSSNIGA